MRNFTGMMTSAVGPPNAKKYHARVRVCVYIQVSDKHDEPDQEPDRIMIDYYYEMFC